MNILVVGLGSMGKRRIRCLNELKISNVLGFDKREDRCNEVSEKYRIKTFNNFTNVTNNYKIDALIISVPPHIHYIYIKKAIELKVPFFVEASVVDIEMEELIKKVNKLNILAAPSATLMFYPALQIIKGIIDENQLGKISNIILHSGQYLPDWHTYEKVSDYYVSNKDTGGAREIVPFEMTWFTKIFGFPKRVSAIYKKTIDIEGAEEIDDTYNFLMDYDDFLSVITVDVVSRFATRRLLVNGSEKQLRWDWEDQYIEIFDPSMDKWNKINYEKGKTESGYNPNISENMYVEEMRNFINALRGKGKYINTLEYDLRVLKLLYKVEESFNSRSFVSV